MDKYVPSYDITEEMLELTAEITEDLGKLSGINDLERLPRLRRVNRIKPIQSSLAIESNTLSLKQVTDIFNGKRVLRPQDDILAVKNAAAAYKMLPGIDPFSLCDLKNARDHDAGIGQRCGRTSYRFRRRYQRTGKGSPYCASTRYGDRTYRAAVFPAENEQDAHAHPFGHIPL